MNDAVQTQARKVHHRGLRRAGYCVIAAWLLVLQACTSAPPRPQPLAHEPAAPGSALPEPAPALWPDSIEEFNASPEPLLHDGLRPDLAPQQERSRAAPSGPPRDLWQRLRQGFALPALEGAAAERAAQAAQSYARSGLLMRSANRAQLYLYPFVAEAERRGLPLELALLPYVESAMNPHARSPVGAVGVCQFMPATGKRFDLAQSAWVDQRRDVLRCANAMFDYLNENHTRFGSWHLALAAYNWGEGAVSRAIEKNRNAGQPAAYEDLGMPRETQNYVPALVGLANLVREPERYGASLPPLANLPPWVEVSLPADMDVRRVLQLARSSRAAFDRLNPGILRPVIPKAVQESIVLPPAAAARFAQALAHERAPLATWGAWRVPSTQRLTHIAKTLGVGSATLAQANDIAPKRLVLAGSVLAVPKRAKGDIDAQVASQGQLRTTAIPVARKKKKNHVQRSAYSSLAQGAAMAKPSDSHANHRVVNLWFVV